MKPYFDDYFNKSSLCIASIFVLCFDIVVPLLLVTDLSLHMLPIVGDHYDEYKLSLLNFMILFLGCSSAIMEVLMPFCCRRRIWYSVLIGAISFSVLRPISHMYGYALGDVSYIWVCVIENHFLLSQGLFVGLFIFILSIFISVVNCLSGVYWSKPKVSKRIGAIRTGIVTRAIERKTSSCLIRYIMIMRRYAVRILTAILLVFFVSYLILCLFYFFTSG
ncbi:hypothetical protein SMSP1_00934 [Sedimentisphaera salicampi]|nr:hypothetical protein SMSP1_00934 [Sedimentisphaera salicampi]